MQDGSDHTTTDVTPHVLKVYGMQRLVSFDENDSPQRGDAVSTRTELGDVAGVVADGLSADGGRSGDLR